MYRKTGRALTPRVKGQVALQSLGRNKNNREAVCCKALTLDGRASLVKAKRMHASVVYSMKESWVVIKTLICVWTTVLVRPVYSPLPFKWLKSPTKKLCIHLVFYCILYSPRSCEYKKRIVLFTIVVLYSITYDQIGYSVIAINVFSFLFILFGLSHYWFSLRKYWLKQQLNRLVIDRQQRYRVLTNYIRVKTESCKSRNGNQLVKSIFV